MLSSCTSSAEAAVNRLMNKIAETNELPFGSMRARRVPVDAPQGAVPIGVSYWLITSSSPPRSA
jgi:hypothetical protein